MLYPEFSLVGYKSNVESKTLICNIGELEIPKQPQEFYVSLYRFDSSVLALPSLANLPSSTVAYADYLVFDFDSRSDLSLALSDVNSLGAALDKIGALYQIWFSGGKGYHLYVPTSQFGFEPTSDEGILKRMAEAMAGSYSTFDKSVYNKTRIFRYPNTWNKAGAYKETLTKTGWESDLLITNDFSINPALYQIYESCRVKVNRTVQEDIKTGDGSLFVHVKEGGRNEAAYTLARKLARRGIYQRDGEFIAQAWNKQLPAPLPPSEIKKVVDSAYTKGVNELVDEGTFAKHIYEIEKAIQECATQFNQPQSGAFFTGYEFLDKLSMGFYPGEVIGIHARNGNFKTAVLENVLQRGSNKQKKPALFFSMEMPNSTLTLRRVQKSFGKSKKEAIEWVKSSNDKSRLVEDWKYVKTCYLSNLGIEEMLGLVDYYQETFGDLSAVGIDYLGLCKGCNNNRERTARMATDLKTRLARAAKAPVFILTQAKAIYEGEKGSIELDRSCPKDSDTIIDSLDYSIGLWKKWGQVDNNRDFLIFGKVLKDRGMDLEAWGSDPYFYLDLDKPTMNLKNIIHIPNPPPFEQLDKSKKGDE